MDYNDNANFAAWMISGGLKSTDRADARNNDHLRALKTSRSASPSLVSRLASAIGAIRPAGSSANAECDPA